MERNESSPGERPNPDLTIRTMKSDVSEFLRSEHPSLVSLAAQQASFEEASSIPTRRHSLPRVVVGGIIALVAIGATATGVWVFWARQENPPPTIAIPPPPFIHAEGVEEIAIARTRRDFPALFRGLSTRAVPRGAFQRLIIRTVEPDGLVRNLSFADLFELTSTTPPADLRESTTGLPQFYLYRAGDGNRLVMMFETKNAARTLQGLIGWESSLAHDLDFLFLTEAVPPVLGVYQDVTYRNIDFRYFPIRSQTDLGIGYLHFTARDLMVISTSAEAIRMTTNRLFEKR